MNNVESLMTPKPSLPEVVNSGTKTEALEAIRDNLAERLERANDNEAAAIARQLVAAIEAIGLAIQLTHHAAQIGPFGQGVAVSPVGGGEVIAGAQMGTHAHGHRLLARGQVQWAAHFGAAIGGFVIGADATLAQDFGGVFEGADARHVGV